MSKLQLISKEQVLNRLALDNPWWELPHELDEFYSNLKPRPYLELLYPYIAEEKIRRAIVLMGPRRVGKTVIIHHAIKRLIDSGISPNRITYIPVDTPIYTGLSLEEMYLMVREKNGIGAKENHYFFFDEIQYLKNWEQHVKSLFDSYKTCRIIVSGSAAAALRLKSIESGAGRFTDFFLPPLTFYEYLEMTGNANLFESRNDNALFNYTNINKINELFVSYINFGGYPEIITSPEIQKDAGRYLRSDIIEKVLLKDLPGLYGIQDIQELNSLFSTISFNTGNEISLDTLSKNSGVAKNTIKRYLEYFEAAFLIRILPRIDFQGKKFQRMNFFKVYLTNCSMRSALFTPLKSDDPFFGNLVETAVFSQWTHTDKAKLTYARWKEGEVDIVNLNTENNKPTWVVEVKWSDRYFEKPASLNNLISFAKANALRMVNVTSLTKQGKITWDGIEINFFPASVHCYSLGRNLIEGKLNTLTKA